MALLPPALPAAVPAGALALRRAYVDQIDLQEAVDGFINPGMVLTPYAFAAMGGVGKRVLVVRYRERLEL